MPHVIQRLFHLSQEPPLTLQGEVVCKGPVLRLRYLWGLPGTRGGRKGMGFTTPAVGGILSTPQPGCQSVGGGTGWRRRGGLSQLGNRVCFGHTWTVIAGLQCQTVDDPKFLWEQFLQHPFGNGPDGNSSWGQLSFVKRWKRRPLSAGLWLFGGKKLRS